jgi:hypothetical protein
MPGGPVTNDGRAPTKAEGQEFSPKLAGVATSLAPPASKEGLERIENAIARWLRPGWCPSQPEPAVDSFAVDAKFGGRNVSTIMRQPGFEFKLGFVPSGLVGLSKRQLV